MKAGSRSKNRANTIKIAVLNVTTTPGIVLLFHYHDFYENQNIDYTFQDSGTLSSKCLLTNSQNPIGNVTKIKTHT
jgi:hypothetical protein